MGEESGRADGQVANSWNSFQWFLKQRIDRVIGRTDSISETVGSIDGQHLNIS